MIGPVSENRRRSVAPTIGARGLLVSTCKNYFKKISSRQNSIFGLPNGLAEKNVQKSNSILDLEKKNFDWRKIFQSPVRHVTWKYLVRVLVPSDGCVEVIVVDGLKV